MDSEKTLRTLKDFIEEQTYYKRFCDNCKETGFYLHCIHDGVQSKCSKCNHRLTEDMRGTCDCEFSPDWEELKQEAIKWVKVLREEAKQNPNDKIVDTLLFTDGKKRKGNPIGKALHDSVKRYTYNYILVRWIKEFFNLTEEDLK